MAWSGLEAFLGRADTVVRELAGQPWPGDAPEVVSALTAMVRDRLDVEAADEAAEDLARHLPLRWRS